MSWWRWTLQHCTEAVRRINEIPYDLLCETALILDAKYVHKNGGHNNDQAVQPAKYKKGDEQKVYAVPCQPEIQTQVQFHEVHQSYYKERQAYTPDMLDENGRKIPKKQPYKSKTPEKVKCVCCGDTISARLRNITQHHAKKHVKLSKPAIANLYKDQSFIYDWATL